jgi:menaquinone-dependent protoporphyrinogen oxidase
MKTLIVYATKTGFVTECVDKLAALLSGRIDKINLAGRPPAVDVAAYDRIMVGGSIHAGRIQKVVKKFCADYTSLLATKKLGLFVACLSKPEEAGKYFDDNFPRSLVVQAKAKACFGGAAYYERMSPLERFIIKKISGTDKSFSKPNDAGIKEMAEAMK